MKHTPGPWIVEPDSRPRMSWNNHIVVETNPERRICFMAHGGDNEKVQVELDADARLIAAAPALYAALRTLIADVSDYEPWQRPCHAVDKARAALALADGEP